MCYACEELEWTTCPGPPNEFRPGNLLTVPAIEEVPPRRASEDVEDRLDRGSYREAVRRATGYRQDSDSLPVTEWSSPHHWPSTFHRSPWWDNTRQKLVVPTMGMMELVYDLEELDEDIRYV